jgi:hypothetical protein
MPRSVLSGVPIVIDQVSFGGPSTFVSSLSQLGAGGLLYGGSFGLIFVVVRIKDVWLLPELMKLKFIIYGNTGRIRNDVHLHGIHTL